MTMATLMVYSSNTYDGIRYQHVHRGYGYGDERSLHRFLIGSTMPYDREEWLSQFMDLSEDQFLAALKHNVRFDVDVDEETLAMMILTVTDVVG